MYDLSFLVRFRITGEDRVRWLNGMVTNTVKDLASGELNYTFLLNAQGRIQGDGEVWALADSLFFVTDRAQAAKLGEQLERFIIMDDVELVPEMGVTALGLAGPGAAELLGTEQLERGHFKERDGALLARTDAGSFTVWVPQAEAASWWTKLLDAGAKPCGAEAVQALRVLRGVPRYGVDITDKSLAQETGQMRALNFNKGCYLGQEIVERIRSRATVHKGLRALQLEGATPATGTALFAEGKTEAVGELTSITQVDLPELAGLFALGTVRTEAASGVVAGQLRYEGGVATVLARAPLESGLKGL